MISTSAVRGVVRVALPSVLMIKKNQCCEVFALVADAATFDANLYILAERDGNVTSMRLECGEFSVVVCLKRVFRTTGATHEVHAPSAEINNEILDLGQDAIWKRHPEIDRASDHMYARQVANSWIDSLVLRKEVVSDGGEAIARGFRLPQIGALHAIAAHWSVRSSHAKIVLPTGTGKTDVIIASSLMKPASRALLVVPSDALRAQISERFARLGVLREIRAVSDSVLNPVVAKLLKTPGPAENLLLLRSANVVISTAQMLIGASDDHLQEFISWFDLVFFDEAHHLPSASWTRISKLIADGTRTLSFTATPYRNDRRRVPGETIYQFPLSMAQKHGYFTGIEVVKIDEPDVEAADLAIATAAIDALRRDERERGFMHVIMARARRREHADDLFLLYSRLCPDLDPVLLHHGVVPGQRKSALEGIVSFRHRVVICVDMLGEGVDIPALKIAALHDSHKSLPITLQFIGRFTRTSITAGNATVVINIADPMADSAVADLFAEDADWNGIVPQLSANAVRGEEVSAAFIATMRSMVSPEDKKFDLGLISVKANASFYSAQRFDPGRVESALPKTSRLHQSWLNEDRNLMIFITQDLKYPAWSISKDAMSFDWNLTLIAFDEVNHLLYVNSTYGDLRNSRIARALAGSSSVLISGERMFRVFDGLHRSVLYNVGLRRRGQLRFQMLAGKDIGDQVSTAIQAGSTKSNLFAVGYMDGSKVSVGASFKGRIWSMASLSIEEWRQWCSGVVKKIKDDAIATDSFLRFTLIPREISSRPQASAFACILPDELLVNIQDNGRRVSSNSDQTVYSQLDISFEKIIEDGDETNLEVSLGGNHIAVFALSWGDEFRVMHRSGPRFFISFNEEVVPLEDFLTLNPPALLLRDGSEVIGKNHFQYPGHLPYTFIPENILPLDWSGVPMGVESKWRNGVMRPVSIQGHMISSLMEQNNTVIFDDDDTGEVSDIIVLTENRENYELEISLYHCKYSSGADPGARVTDLYEVCGQAVKSSRLAQLPDTLLKHMIRREVRLGGRPTRFERGSLAEVNAMLRRLSRYRARVSICVVQPGLSASLLTPELSAILAAADGFIFEFTGRRLKVFGSA